MTFESVLVTGGAGFVGSAVCLALKQCLPELRICALDNLNRRGSELNLQRLREGGVQFIYGDIRSIEDVVSVQPPPDLIIECSAEPSAQAGYSGSPEYLMRTNLVGAFHCLELARRTHAAILFMSTSRVYPFQRLNELAFEETDSRFVLSANQSLAGASAHGISEEFPLSGVRSLYGMTKLSAELMVQEYANAYNIPYIINRCGLLTGPWQMAKSDQGVVALWIAAHYFRRPLKYIGFGGSGKQVRDFLHIDDFCALVLDQIKNFALYANGTWNVGGGLDHSLSLREMTVFCREVTGNRLEVGSVAENRPADVRIYLSDFRKLNAVNGWTPCKNARQTLSDIFEWLRQAEGSLNGII